MSPSPLLHPVGPQPARIYWLRRGLLIGVVLVIVVAVGLDRRAGEASLHGRVVDDDDGERPGTTGLRNSGRWDDGHGPPRCRHGGQAC